MKLLPCQMNIDACCNSGSLLPCCCLLPAAACYLAASGPLRPSCGRGVRTADFRLRLSPPPPPPRLPRPSAGRLLRLCCSPLPPGCPRPRLRMFEEGLGFPPPICDWRPPWPLTTSRVTLFLAPLFCLSFLNLLIARSCTSAGMAHATSVAL